MASGTRKAGKKFEVVALVKPCALEGLHQEAGTRGQGQLRCLIGDDMTTYLEAKSLGECLLAELN
jgi:hypothetical protein